jgi:hypothetical protein
MMRHIIACNTVGFYRGAVLGHAPVS